MHRYGGVPVRVTVLDSDVLAQYGLRSLFSRDTAIELVQQVKALGEVNSALTDATDVLLVSLDTVEKYGDATGVIQTLATKVKVLVTSASIDTEQVVMCLSAGAAGYVWKGVEPVDIAQAVLQAAAGEHPILPPIAGELLFHVLSTNTRKPVNTLGLTNREQEVLNLIANGMSNKEIAVALNLSIRTVKAHVSNVLQKLNVEDRTQAAVMAIRSGVVSGDTSHAAAARYDNSLSTLTGFTY